MRPGVRLGVDVGSVRVGLAASDREGLVASPVATLARDGDGDGDGDGAGGRAGEGGSGAGRRGAAGRPGVPRDVAAVVREAREREAVEVVVGLPVSLSGREGPAAVAVRRYAATLAAAVAPTPVRLVDERLSTVTAHQALRASGRPGRRQRSVVDQVAAVVILQQALDAERASGVLGEQVGPDARATTGGHDGRLGGGHHDAREARSMEAPWTA